jgi:hypothetical protein
MQVDPLTAAEHFVKSGFFRDAADVSKAVVKILYGAEFGFPPVASMLNIHIVEGKPSMGAHFIGAAIRKAGYDYRVVEATNKECSIEYFDRHGKLLGTSSFTWQDAVTAELAGKMNWKKYPKAMLYARAMSQGARMHVADAFLGAVYTPDELGAEVVLDETGNISSVIDITPRRSEQDAPTDRRASLSVWEGFTENAIAVLAGIGCGPGVQQALLNAVREHMGATGDDEDPSDRKALGVIYKRIQKLTDADGALAYAEELRPAVGRVDVDGLGDGMYEPEGEEDPTF